MERDIRYITVGLIVAVLLSAGVGLILWQVSDQSTGRGGQAYVIAFEGSVGGLNVGSAVRYMGMRAGNVTRVGVARDRVDQVEVHIQLNKQTPINASTVAQIRPQGITGRSYVGLTTAQPTDEAGPARTSEHHEVPILRGEPSQLDRLLTRLPELLTRFETVAASAEELLNADNRQAIGSILDNADQSVASVDALLNADNRAAVATSLDNSAELTGQAVRLTADAQEVMAKLAGNLEALEATLGETTQTARAARDILPALKSATTNAARLSQRLDHWMAEHGATYGALGTRNLRQGRALLEEARRTSRAIRDLSEQLSNNPSQLIFKPAEEGMEIPR